MVVRQSLFGVALACAGVISARAGDRPPQFVLVAFDNCSEIERWEYWRDITKELKGAVSFTFFVSGTNFLSNDTKTLYKGPYAQPGKANIDFSSSADEIAARNRLINTILQQGHEIGSHAVGHFDGTAWRADDWHSEFESYSRLFDRVTDNNGLDRNASFAIQAKDLRGFRAPYLGITWQQIAPELVKSGFSYDTSDTGEPGDWPSKSMGIWKFNLASIDVVGTGKKNLSMDYNFYVTQSHATENPPNQPIYRQQMLDSYLKYFKANYEGNRAPIHIGHHFADYQGGVYRAALTAFIRQVCVMPEVKCTAYSKLADFLESKSAAELGDFAAGNFAHAPMPALGARPFAKSEPLIHVEQTGPFKFEARLIGPDAERFKGSKFEWIGPKTRVQGKAFSTQKLPISDSVPISFRLKGPKGETAYERKIEIKKLNDRAEIVRGKQETE